MKYFCPVCGHRMKAIFCECKQHDAMHTFKRLDGSSVCGKCGLDIEPNQAKELEKAFSGIEEKK